MSDFVVVMNKDTNEFIKVVERGEVESLSEGLVVVASRPTREEAETLLERNRNHAGS